MGLYRRSLGDDLSFRFAKLEVKFLPYIVGVCRASSVHVGICLFAVPSMGCRDAV